MRHLAVAACVLLLMTLVLPSQAAALTVTRTWGVGVEPFGVTIDPRDGTVYVAISDHNNISGSDYMWAIDPTDPCPYCGPGFPRFPMPRTQVMSVLDLGLDRLFVSMPSGLAVVDPHTHAVLATVPLASGIGLALDASSHHVFVAMGSAGVAIVDGSSGAVLATRTVASANDVWWHVASDPQRHLLFVTNGNFTGSPSLVVLNDSDLSLVANIPLPAQPRLALAVDPGRGLVYVGGFASASSSFGRIYGIDESTFQTVKTVDVSAIGSPFSFTLAPDASSLYVSAITQFAGALVTIDVGTFTVADDLPLAFQPGQSALGPDGHLYVSEFDKSALAQLSFDSAPSVGVVLSSTSPRTTDVLTATATGTDPDGDALTFTYTWTVNGVVRRTTTTASNTDSLDLSVAGNGDKGDVIGVSVTAFDGTLSSPAASATATVGNSAPTVTVTLNTTAPRSKDTLVATATGIDPDGDALTYTYTWSVSRKVKLVVTTTSPTSSFDLHTNDVGNGDNVTVTVTASDGALSSTPSTASATVGKN